MRWVAQPRQAAFLLADEYAVLFGGARGGGKTDALLAHAITVATEHPGSRTLFLRRNFTDLNQPGAAIPRSHQFLGRHATWHGGNYQWTFRNGSVLKFGHLSDQRALTQYLGTQVDVLLLDQAEQLAEHEYQQLQGSVRATVDGIKPHVRLTANPGGIGHAWVKARWIDAATPDTPYTIEEGGRPVTHRFVPSRVYDNPALLERDPEYVARLQSLGGHLARAWVEGDWDQFEGQVFSEWRRDKHVVEPFPIPKEWPRWRGVDYGYASPYCCLWAALSPSGVYYVYRETYGTGLLDRDQAQQIRLLSAGEQIRATFGDPSMWAQRHNGYQVQAPAAAYAEMGVPLTPANNDRPSGWQRLHELLAWEHGLPPRLQVFSSCTNLIRTLPALVYDPHDVEDVDTRGDDHAPDSLRYLLMGASVPQPRVQQLRIRA